MKVKQVVAFHLHYHWANSKKNTVNTCEFVLSRFTAQLGKRDLASISLTSSCHHIDCKQWYKI